MNISITVSSLKALASVTAAVPVAGPALGAVLQVATQVCEALDGVRANREEYAQLAAEVAQHARAVSEAVQSELQFTPESQNATDENWRKVIDEIEKLTSVFREVEDAVKTRHEKDKKRNGNISDQAKRMWDGLQNKEDDKDKVRKLREKVEKGVKDFQIRTNIRVLGAVQRIEASVHTTAATTLAELQRIETSRIEEYQSMASHRAEERRQDRMEREEEAERVEIRRAKERWQDRVDRELEYMRATLAPVFSARFDAAGAPEPCLPQTRGALLDQIKAWASDDSPSSANMFCLTGLAGTGKTTIAQSISSYYDRKRPSANFLISRFSANRRNPDRIIQTVIYQLGQGQDAVRTAICEALRNGRDITTRPLAEQVEDLFTVPLKALDPSSPPALIVIDAMDECDKIGDREGGEFILLIAAAIRHLSGRVKVLITSREEREIMAMFKILGLNRSESSIRLQNIEDVIVRTDIETFYLYHFRRIAESAGIDFMGPWPSKADLDLLVNRTGKLFVYAALIIRLFKVVGRVSRVDPRKVLKDILRQSGAPTSGSAFRALDELYLGILEKATTLSKDNDTDLIERVRRVLAALVLVQTPLNGQTIARLLDEDVFYVRGDIEHLSAVLIISDNEDEPVTIFHPSFIDYIVTRCLDQRFRVDLATYHTDIARCCLNIMIGHLKRNILEIEDPFSMNNDIENLKKKQDDCLPLELRYACEYWMAHVSNASHSDKWLKENLDVFSNHHLLHWLEVLSLLGKLSAALKGLPSVIRWYRQAEGSDMTTTLTLLEDTEALIQVYDVPIREAALQVYHSAVTFMPVCDLQRRAKNETNEVIRLRSKRLDSWPLLRRTLRGHTEGVTSVVFSSDGMRIASGSEDMTVRVWDAITGQLVVQHEGHTNWITSVAFSPDGTRIASASFDKTVRVWNVITGHLLFELGAYTSWVTSVTFSPNGMHIASGSGDKTIHMWDASTGNLLARFEGHSGEVTSIAFSPDGMRVTSGSNDNTVRIWDANTGFLYIELEGHTLAVKHVAFSPNGKHIASGSEDKTVRLWDANNGQPLAQLEGHTNWVTSVTFSPDGTRIVSGSVDTTVRVWDVITGDLLAKLQGHTTWVTSVTFSSDKMRIASSSWDKTVRVWDANIRQELAQLEGHADRVTSVAFSPDRTLIASGSWDNTMLVWDAITGHPLNGQKIHTSRVISVTFSRDGTHAISNSFLQESQVWFASSHIPKDKISTRIVSRTALHAITSEQTDVNLDYQSGWLHVKYSPNSCLKRVCWIPPERRGIQAWASGDVVVIATESGGMTILSISY